MDEQPNRPAGAVSDLVASVKPRLRGWLHLGMFPVALVGGIVLVLVSDPGAVRTACAVFTVSATLLFGVSAVYHRGSWGPRMAALLKRFDHSNIYLIIAGTYTPFAVTLLPGDEARLLLTIIWLAAIAGVAFRIAWTSAPRWLYTALYIAMGWAALGWQGSFYITGGPAVFTLILAGGVCYTIGAVVYGRRRPNPSPAWFGFHEIFHAGTLGGFVCHYIAISLATYGATA